MSTTPDSSQTPDEQAPTAPPTVDEFARLLFAPGRDTFSIKQSQHHTEEEDEAARAFLGLTNNEPLNE